MLMWILLACWADTWSSADDCEGLSKGPNKDQCWSVHLIEVFKEDLETGDRIAQAQITDSRIRDFIYLSVTREIDPSTTKWCDKMVDTAMKSRCQVLVSRPHLHRDVLQQKKMPEPKSSE